jgi:mRNA-degrading endonuclease RelE of RelBE toxin-antitoxin system
MSIWMSYKLYLHKLTLEEWRKIDSSVLEPLKKKLTERLKSHPIPSSS